MRHTCFYFKEKLIFPHLPQYLSSACNKRFHLYSTPIEQRPTFQEPHHQKLLKRQYSFLNAQREFISWVKDSVVMLTCFLIVSLCTIDLNSRVFLSILNCQASCFCFWKLLRLASLPRASDLESCHTMEHKPSQSPAFTRVCYRMNILSSIT